MPEANVIAEKTIANVEKVIVGKRRQIILALVSWFSEGHIPLEAPVPMLPAETDLP